jgi:uncharacterized protein YqkB
MKSIPPAEGLAKSVTPTVELVDSAFSHFASFQSDFVEMYRRWSFDAFYAASMSTEVNELQDKLSTSIAAHKELKSNNWHLANKQIAEKMIGRPPIIAQEKFLKPELPN